MIKLAKTKEEEDEEEDMDNDDAGTMLAGKAMASTTLTDGNAGPANKDDNNNSVSQQHQART